MDSSSEFVVLGTAGFALEVANLVIAAAEDPQPHLAGYLGPEAPQDSSMRWLGDDAILDALDPAVEVAIGIGRPAIRERLGQMIHESGRQSVSGAVHPSVRILADCEMGTGTMLAAGTVASFGVRLGDHVFVNHLVSLGHEVTVGSYSVINPCVALSGGSKIGNGVLVGTHAVVLENVEVGDGAVIGAGAVVTKDVAAGELVVGVPAKPR